MVKRKISDLVTGSEIEPVVDTDEPIKRKSSRALKAVDYTSDNVNKLADDLDDQPKKEKKSKIGSSGTCGKEKG